MNRVLIVEDNEAGRLVLRHIVKKHFKCEVDEAVNGIEGLERFAEAKPDLVLLDIMMPLMNGIEFLEAVREDPSAAETPVLVLTGVGDKKLVAQMIELGVSDYILKPYEKKDVISRIENMELRHSSTKRRQEFKQKKKEYSLKNKKVLVASSNEAFTSTFSLLFDGILEIFTAKDGTEALTSYLNNRPEVVILGQNLPVINEMLLGKKLLSFDKDNASELFLAAENEEGIQQSRGTFDNAFLISDDPAELMPLIAEKVLAQDSLAELAEIALEIESEAVTKTVVKGVAALTGTQLQKMQPHFPEAELDHLVAVTNSEDLNSNFSVELKLFGIKNEFISLLGKNTEEEGQQKAQAEMKKLMNAIAEYIRKKLMQRGIPLNAPRFSLEEHITTDSITSPVIYNGYISSEGATLNFLITVKRQSAANSPR